MAELPTAGLGNRTSQGKKVIASLTPPNRAYSAGSVSVCRASGEAQNVELGVDFIFLINVL